MEIPPYEPHQPPLATSAWGETALTEQVKIRQQKIQRDFNAPLGGFLVRWFIIILLLIVGMVLLDVFHILS